jgi:RNA polymerase sigma-70 factor (ECF subfamily)
MERIGDVIRVMRTNAHTATEQECLWRAHAAELTRYATLLVGPVDASDVVAEAFLRATAGDLGEVSNRRAYLFRAVTNTANDWRRSARRRRARDRHAVTGSVVPGFGEVPDTDLHRAIGALSVQQRSVVYFTYWEDLDSSTVAEYLQIAPATVRRHLARARHQLRRVLS